MTGLLGFGAVRVGFSKVKLKSDGTGVDNNITNKFNMLGVKQSFNLNIFVIRILFLYVAR